MYRNLVFITLGVAFIINLLSAFVRLADAGIGCADWPSCYGKVAIAWPEGAAAAKNDASLVDEVKGAIRLVHRFFATLLGLMILGIGILAWSERERFGPPPVMASVLVILMVALALVGQSTVTHPVQPVIATFNALGGMAVVACLTWLAMGQIARTARIENPPVLRLWCGLGAGLVFLQVASGIWVSTNFAALACGEFPLCRGVWVPSMDFGAALEWGHPAQTAYSPEALAAIHWIHRLIALVTLIYLAALAIRLARVRGLTGYGTAVAGLVLAETGLGIANVAAGLPLLGVLGHNALGALLLMAVTMLNFKTRIQRA